MASSSYPSSTNRSVTEGQYENLIGRQAADGLLGRPSDPVSVYADGTGVRTARLRANVLARVRGFMFDSGDEETPIQFAANTSGVTRVDLVVLRLTRSTWRVRETVIQGTPGQGAPVLVRDVGDTGIYDLPIAQVTVAHNASALTAVTVTSLAWYIGSDGKVLCTPQTRPPHELGLVIWDGQLQVSNGSKWLSAADDYSSSAITVLGGYTASHNLLERYGKWVSMQLTVTRTNADMPRGVASAVGSVPDGYRPRRTLQTTAGSAYGPATCVVAVNADGSVYVNPGGDVVPKGRSVVFAMMSWVVL